MKQENILVLGIGNLLCADDGFGVQAVQELHRQWRFPERVTLMNGGTQGFGLLPHVQQAQRMIVFDAVDYGLSPGTIKVLENEQVPRFLGAKKMSPHRIGFQDVLAVTELTGNLPAELVLIGVQPACTGDYGGSLNELVNEKIPTVLAIALFRLQRWGCSPEPRNGELECMESLLPASLTVDVFDSAHPGTVSSFGTC